MYACVKLSADFLRWCAGRRIADPICATYPLTIRELAPTHASRSKGENGAGNTSSAPFARSGYEVLCHKLVDVVVETVVKAVDVSQPTVPACPLPITYPTFSEARHPDTIGLQAVAGYCSHLRLGVVPWRNHSETWAGCIVSLTTPTRSSLSAARSVSLRSLAEKASRVFTASYFLR